MMQMELGTPVPAARILAPGGQDLRPYQEGAVGAIHRELKTNRSTLVVMPTGSGKTRVFGEVVKGWDGRALVLAHRDELIDQARLRISEMTGECVGLEQAEFWAGDERIVVASIQSISQPERLKRWDPSAFGLVVCDEAHHAVAETWKRTIEHFQGAKILGVTATPDRADERAMGQVFESVAFCYEIEDAIRDGWLCKIRVRQNYVESINLSACGTVAGDLNQGDLDDAMAVEQNLHAVAVDTAKYAEDRRTLIFTTSIENATRIAEIMCRYNPLCARSIDSKMGLDQRRENIKAFQRGDYQYLINVGIATEGYDDPNIRCISMARPTKSRALYAQMAGRGLRPKSGPPNDLLLIEFTGNSGKHRLASACDILGGKFPEEVVDAAQEMVRENPGMDPQEALEKAAEERAKEAERRRLAEIARRANIRANVKSTYADYDPFEVFNMRDKEEELDERFGGKMASEAQLGALGKWKIDVPQNCTMRQANRLIGQAVMRKQKGLASYGQIKTLKRYGVQASNMYRETASNVLDAIAKNSWRPLSREVMVGLTRARDAGEEG